MPSTPTFELRHGREVRTDDDQPQLTVVCDGCAAVITSATQLTNGPVVGLSEVA